VAWKAAGMSAELFTGRWEFDRIQRLAMKAVRGDADGYYRWSAFYVSPDKLVEPSFWFMVDALLAGADPARAEAFRDEMARRDRRFTRPVDAVNPWAEDAEAQLIHGARMRFAAWSYEIARREQPKRAITKDGKVKRADWMPEFDKYNRERGRESRDLRRVLAQTTVHQMLLACKQEGFEVMDSYFNSEDGLGQRAAAKELSRRLGRPVSVREYNEALTDVRLELAEWLLGYRPARESLGRWPDARNWSWVGAVQELAPMFDSIREQRTIA
jgi:hypothetical protein